MRDELQRVRLQAQQQLQAQHLRVLGLKQQLAIEEARLEQLKGGVAMVDSILQVPEPEKPSP